MTRSTWRFPSRNGGIDYVNDPSSAYFSDAPIAKLVRELIQNPLDTKHDGFADPVTVTFSETRVKRGLIGGASLQRHLQSCLDRANDDDRPDMVDVYTNALAVIRQRGIPCLKVHDTGTMFLMASTRTGISAKQLEREIGVTYKTTWRIFKQIRQLMAQDGITLFGEIEVDETYIGGRRPGKRGRGADGKTIVARNGGARRASRSQGGPRRESPHLAPHDS